MQKINSLDMLIYHILINFGRALPLSAIKSHLHPDNGKVDTSLAKLEKLGIIYQSPTITIPAKSGYMARTDPKEILKARS